MKRFRQTFPSTDPNVSLVTHLLLFAFCHRLVRDNESAPERITEIIDALVQDFVYSNNSNARYGGLIGLAATAIALGPVRPKGELLCCM
jgi:hypothetical protein